MIDCGLFVWSVSAAGIMVDDLVMQLVGLRYTEPDMTISYPGFLYLLMKLESMIRKGGRGDWLGKRQTSHCHGIQLDATNYKQ